MKSISHNKHVAPITAANQGISRQIVREFAAREYAAIDAGN